MEKCIRLDENEVKEAIQEWVERKRYRVLKRTWISETLPVIDIVHVSCGEKEEHCYADCFLDFLD